MVVSIVGGHGQIAIALTGLLSAEGVAVRSLIRNADHAEDCRAVGGVPVVADFELASEAEIDEALAGSDVVVFAAGAGPGSGAERKETVDYGAAVQLIEASQRASESSGKAPRYVMISAVRADPDYPGDEVFAIYQRAKGRADAELIASGLDHLILRPVRLTEEPANGSISLTQEVDQLESAEVPREDVAAVLAEAIIRHPEASGIWNLSSGSTPVPQSFT